MTENKPIMIDGVDVSECEYYQYDMCTATKDNYGDCSSYCKDYDMKNCYFKQLARKTRECEELKKGYSKLTDIVSPYMDDFTGYNEELGGFDIALCVKELMEQLDQLKAQNETYKKMLDNPEVRVALTDIRTGERDLWQKYKPRMEQAEQKLEKIKNRCNETLELMNKASGTNAKNKVG